ncbi:hypothetical protein HX789_09810, partial [Pseudomonas sp. IPO3779]|nr:hypothetical protein [Pseudomonas sp. IPO3779]
MFGVLGSRNYRHVFLARIIALIGSGGVNTVVLGLLAFDLAGACAGVGCVHIRCCGNGRYWF